MCSEQVGAYNVGMDRCVVGSEQVVFCSVCMEPSDLAFSKWRDDIAWLWSVVMWAVSKWGI